MTKIKLPCNEFDVLNHIPVGVCIIDEHYTVIFWNYLLESWTGIDANLIVGKKIDDFFYYFKKPSYRLRLQSIFQGGAPVIFSSQLHKHLFTAPGNPGKNVHTTTVTALPCQDHERYYAMFSVENVAELSNQIQQYRKVRDQLLDEIKQRKRTEKELIKAKKIAENSDRLKSAFLANMSHEIRTPLNGIIGFSNFLRVKDLSKDKNKEYLEIISSSGQHLLNLINDIIDISKIESGQISLNPARTDLNNLLDELYSFFLSHLQSVGQSNIELILKKGLSDFAAYIHVDETRLRQILTNLLANAAKFTEKGHIKFGYKLKTENEIPYLEFFVKDTGIGLSKEKLDSIFDRFSQADDSITRKYGGTGLGLAISKAFTQMMEGQIWVESKENSGSTFYFTIPYHPSESSEHDFYDKPKQEGEYDWSKYHILIVEDREVSRLFLKVALEETHANLHFANNAKQAMRLIDNFKRIDIVLMDIHLPEISGYEITKWIKKRRSDLPVIAQTSNAMADEKEKAFHAGCDDYLTKPIERKKLLVTIDRYIQIIDKK